MSDMSLKLRFGIYFGVPHTVGSLLMILSVYAVLYVCYFDLKDELIRELLDNKLENFILTSDYTGMQSVQLLKVNGQTMMIIADIIRKYQGDKEIFKKNISSEKLLNGVEFEKDHQKYTELPIWYLNNKTETELQLEGDGLEDLNMSKAIRSVLEAYKDTRTYLKYYVGYSSGFYFTQPSNYSCTFFTNDKYYPENDPCGPYFNVSCTDWYKQTMKSNESYPIMLYPIFNNCKDETEQLVCKKFTKEGYSDCVVCIRFNTFDTLQIRFENFYLKDIANIVDLDGTVIYRYDSEAGSKSLLEYEFGDDPESNFAYEFEDRIVKLFEEKVQHIDRYTLNNLSTRVIRSYPMIIDEIPHIYTLTMIVSEGIIMDHLQGADRFFDNLLYFQGVIYIYIVIMCHIITFIITFNMANFLTSQYYDLIQKLEDMKQGNIMKFENVREYSCREINELYDVFNSLAVVYRLNDDREFESLMNAIHLYKRARVLFSTVENDLALYHTHYHLGFAYMLIPNYSKAASAFESCLNLSNIKLYDKKIMYRVCVGLIISYTKLRDTDKAMTILRLIYDRLESERLDKEIRRFLLVECYFKIKNMFPIQDILEIIKADKKDLDEISLQIYYYYKAKFKITQGMQKSALKSLVKNIVIAIQNKVQKFDPVCRRKALKLMTFIYQSNGLDPLWPEQYLQSISPSRFNIILFSTLSNSMSHVLTDFMQGIRYHLRTNDMLTLLINSRTMYKTLPYKANIEYLDLYEDNNYTALYDGIAHSTRFLSLKVRDISNWVIILSDKMEKGSSKSLCVLEKFGDKRAVNYIIISAHEIYGCSSFLQNSPRNMTLSDLDNINIPEIIYWMFCMRCKPDTFITEKALYDNHLLI
jgi:hypothetical protein